MDSITQIALGAAVGEAVLGKEVGNKALLWGAIMGTVPDLDVFVGPFVSQAQQLGIHRGFSHSITFAILGAPVFGSLIHKIHKRKHKALFKGWSWLVFWALFTHIFLDAFTMYGTQVFQPFSDYPLGFDTIFVIDPLYTLPLLISMGIIIFRKLPHHKRKRINTIALALSSLYLVVTVVNKLHVNSVFSSSLRAQSISYDRLFSSPTVINNLLWMGIAEVHDEDKLLIGLYSVLDGNKDVRFVEVNKNSELLSGADSDFPIRQLLWFSRGFYTLTESDGELYFNDLRFGRSDIWLNNFGSYIFRFRLIQSTNDTFTDFQRINPSIDFGNDLLGRLVDRILGEMP